MTVQLLCATTASVLGDLVAYRLAWRGGARLDRAIARSPRLTSARERLGAALGRGGELLVVIARFAPAGCSGRPGTAGDPAPRAARAAGHRNPASPPGLIVPPSLLVRP